ncbi:hypothetical protein ACJMK2_024721 [Sinanodonta woodiana]|uniref:Uncharacterized protein n=1 Tax=Sinanodonta woodiana TaxID=1069815 RepID=A0ABD3XI26_SINWO
MTASITETRKDKILKSLRKKLLFRRATHTSEGPDSGGESSVITKVRRGILAGNKNANKGSRKIEIGWLNFDTSNQMCRQVRKKRGGSTRRVDICKESTIKEVEAVAKSLFFPNGTSPNGPIENFDFEIRDFSGEKTECKETIGEINILRFYLASK